jgi:hypothetical protein
MLKISLCDGSFLGKPTPELNLQITLLAVLEQLKLHH